MDNQSNFDRGLIIPILIGGFSIVGIIIVLLIGRSLSLPAAVAVSPSATPFEYIYLGTEPAISTESGEGSEPESSTDVPVPINSPTPRPLATVPVLGTTAAATPGSASTQNNALTPNNSGSPPIQATTPASTAPPTSTSASGAPLNPGTYDDVDSHLIYVGPGWIGQTNIAGAHNNTLHVSQVPGSLLNFSFIGTQVRIFYQGASSLGTMRITIDDETFNLDQSDGQEWVSDSFDNGTHNVLITHISGGAVNLDYVIIPEVPTTPTPTRTSTPQ
jgi:hypothetical protein